MNERRWILAVLTTLVTAGCQHPYEPAAGLLEDEHATLELRSTTNTHVPLGFYVQLYDYGDRCPNFLSGGAKDRAYLGDLEIERNDDAVVVPVPANSNVFIQWAAGGSGGVIMSMKGFRSVAGRRYLVELSSNARGGRWAFRDETTGAPVRIMGMHDCD